MRDERRRNIRVGALAVFALAVLILTIFLVGQRQQLFVRHNTYLTSFEHVSGLQRGAPVTLDGVTVGFVQDISLPTSTESREIQVAFTVQTRYAGRIRADTVAYIKTVGLLGDKYLEIRGGSADAEIVPEHGTVRGEDPAELRRFVSGGEDLMRNLLAISSSLRTVLSRIEKGEGLFGELTMDTEGGRKFRDSANEAVETLARILNRIDQGHGLAGRLINDDERGDAIMEQMAAAAAEVRRIAETVRTDLGRDDTAWAGLTRDPEGRRRLRETMTTLHTAAQALATASEELSEGEGTLPRLLRDEEYADDFLSELAELVRNLRRITEKTDTGEGTFGALLNDPRMYEDLADIVRGVEDSKLLSWFLRNRREKGEELREAEDR